MSKRLKFLVLISFFVLSGIAKDDLKVICDYYLTAYLAENPNLEISKLGSRNKVVKVDQKFRKKFLAASADQGSLKLVVNSVMADLRNESTRILSRLKKFKGAAKVDEASQTYDVLVIGAGVQDGILQNSFKQFSPDLKVVSVEQSNLVANTFGMSPDFFRINSTNRKEDFFVNARPGKGNINRLSGGSIQIPDLSAEKYPRAGNIFNATVLNRANSNGSVLFQTKVLKVEDSKVLNTKFPARYKVTIQNGKDTFELYANHISIPSGLGTESLRITDKKTVDLIAKERKKIARMTKRSTKLPGVMTFNDARQLATLLDQPFKGYAGKEVMVVGEGDSGKVTLEYLFKEAPDAAYKNDKAQVGEVAGVTWAGATEQTCKAYITGNRVRYSKIAAALKNNTLTPLDSKLVSIKIVKVNGVERYQVNFSDGRKKVVDHLILSTGFQKKYGELLTSITGSTAGDLQRAELLDPVKTPLVGGNKKVTVAYKLSDTSLNDGTEISHNIYVHGPAVNLIKDESIELLEGVPQNSVSIFNNGDRNYAAGFKIAQDIKPQGFKRVPKPNKMKIENVNKNQSEGYLFSIFDSSRYGSTSLNAEYYLLAKTLEKLERFDFSSVSKNFSIKISKTSKDNVFEFRTDFASPQVRDILITLQNDVEIQKLISLFIGKDKKKNVLDFDLFSNSKGFDLKKSALSIYKTNDTPISGRTIKPKKEKADYPGLFKIEPLETAVKKVDSSLKNIKPKAEDLFWEITNRKLNVYIEKSKNGNEQLYQSLKLDGKKDYIVQSGAGIEFVSKKDEAYVVYSSYDATDKSYLRIRGLTKGSRKSINVNIKAVKKFDDYTTSRPTYVNKVENLKFKKDVLEAEIETSTVFFTSREAYEERRKIIVNLKTGKTESKVIKKDLNGVF